MPQTSATLNVMLAAARKAARALARDFGEVENLQVSRKGPSDFVSSADIKAEKTIFEELSKARPGYGFVMEERGEVEGTDKSHRWLVDPLDGTTNFLHGIPHFAISIGLEREGVLVAGVVYNVIRDELFWAEKGAGAYLNDRRLRVAARTDIREAVFATGTPFHGKPGHQKALGEIERVIARSAGIRRFGAAALDLAYVAAGRYDGYWERGLNAWDIGAGAVIVREAGGIVTEIDGGDFMKTGAIVAANERLLPHLQQALRG
ncbi:inositol monophosphatase family protein [Vitreimonas sp.]|jgi:myo-inositol-1(or 4)-monophosphatase|uniref:inositol monophosphatase family protein n=1 Tax=Vitreimonas sp. TaxID=3069702 RepID=UPI002ED7A8FC